MLNVLIKILLNPPKWLTLLLVKLFAFAKRHPKRAIIDLMAISCFLVNFSIIIYFSINYSYEKIEFLHKNHFVIKSVLDKEIKGEIKDINKRMGKGSSVFRISIGFINPYDIKPSMDYDIGSSYIPYGFKDPIIDPIELNPKRYNTIRLSRRDLSSLNKDTINVYSSDLSQIKNMPFGENMPMCYSVHGKNKKETIDFVTIKGQYPSLSQEILRVSNEIDSETAEEEKDNIIRDICLIKIKHPLKDNVIFLFTLTFWSYNNIYFKPNLDEAKRRLEKLGNLQINHLLEMHNVK